MSVRAIPKYLSAILIVVAALFAAMHVSQSVMAQTTQAPAASQVSAAFRNYTRASPLVGSSGTLKPGGVAEAKKLGFATIIDLRTPPEGTDAERAEARKAGIGYVNIPIARNNPTAADLAKFTKILQQAGNKPVLVHCASGNRVGAMWTLYRASRGIAPERAISEGRKLGLRSPREARLRRELNLPPMATPAAPAR